MNKLKGKAYKFGDNINTDYIIPGRRLYVSLDMEYLSQYLMEDYRPDFISKVKKGDFIVAGENFGCGSAREQATKIIAIRGISAVLAKSFSRTFFRNALGIGLPLINCYTDEIQEGDILTVDLDQNLIYNISKKKQIDTTVLLTGLPLDIIKSKGIYRYFLEKGYI